MSRALHPLLFLLAAYINGAFTATSNCFFMNDINIMGGTYDEFDTHDLKACCIRCSSTQCCIAYTYDKGKKRCYLKSSVSFSEERQNFISGIKANGNNGMTADLRNILIEGNGAQTPLSSDLECKAYCSSHGVSVYRPARIEIGEEAGLCTCPKRIEGLRYVYGVRSSILGT